MRLSMRTTYCLAFAIAGSTLSFATSESPTDSNLKSVILDFDDLVPPPSCSGRCCTSSDGFPIYDLPDRYNHLQFASFSVFEPQSDELAGIIDPHDRNCASSFPNALLGSHGYNKELPVPAFEVARKNCSTSANDARRDSQKALNQQSRARHALESALRATYNQFYALIYASCPERPESIGSDITSFDLLGMTLKPLIAPPGDEEITLWIKGYRFDDDSSMQASEQDWPRSGILQQSPDELLWHVDFPVGWHLPFTPEFPPLWRWLRRVEMWAEYGSQKLDWEFCIDDLRVKWHRMGETEDGDIAV